MTASLRRLLALACLLLAASSPSLQAQGSSWTSFVSRLEARATAPGQAELVRQLKETGLLAEVVESWELSRTAHTEANLEYVVTDRELLEGEGREYARLRRAILRRLADEPLPAGTSARFLSFGSYIADQGRTLFPSLRTQVVRVGSGPGAQVRQYLYGTRLEALAE